MSNSAVRWFRAVSPETTLTDAQITLKAYDLARGGDQRFAVFDSDPDYLSQAQAWDKERRLSVAPGYVGEAVKAIKSGIDSTQAKFFDTLALVGSATGLDTVRDFGQRKAEENLAEASENAPTLPDFTEVGSIGEGIRFLVGLAGSQAPQLAAVLGGSALGAVAGAAAAPALGAAAATAAGIGAAAGGGTTAFTQTQNYGDLIRQGIPEDEAVKIGFGTGVLSAALESLVPAMAVTPLFKAAGAAGGKQIASSILKGLPEKAYVQILRNAAKHGGIDGVAEAATEVAQEALTIASEVYANRNNPDFKLDDDDINRRLLNAGVAGGILGAGLGGISGGVTANRATPPPSTTPDPATVPPATEPQDIVTGQAEIAVQRPIEDLPVDPVQPVEQTVVQEVEQESETLAQNLETVLVNQDVDGFEEVSQKIQAFNSILQRQQIENSLQSKLLEVITRNRDAVNQIRERINALRNQQGLLPETTVSQPEIQKASEIESEVEVLPPVVEPSEKQATISDEVKPNEVPIITEPDSSNDPASTLINVLDDEKSVVVEDTSDTKKNIARQPFVLNIDETTDEAVLVDGSRSQDGNASRAVTRKIVFFEDTDPNMDGRVIGLPVFRDGKGVVRVARPDFMVKLKRDGTRSQLQQAVPYSEVLADGRLAPIYAVRVKNDAAFKASDPNSAIYYNDATDLENRLITDAKVRLAQNQESSSDVYSTSAEVDDGEGGSVEANRVGLTNLENTISDPNQSVEVDPLTELQGLVSEITGSSRPTESQIMEAFGKIASDVDNHALLRQYFSETILESGIANDIAFRQLLTHEQEARIYNIASSRFAAAINASTQEVNQGSAGRTESASFFSIRENQGYPENTSQAVRGRFFSVLESLGESGIAVSLDQAISQEFGEFSPSRNSITLALNDTQSPSLDNFRLLLHEAAHVVASSLPADIYNAVQRAVSRYSREKLNLLSNSADPRIRENNPADLPPQELAEEIFSETLAQEFGNREVSQSIAARIFRVLKDIYFRSAMLVQRMFGRPPSPEVAEAYARNRFEQLVGGDAQSLTGFLVSGFEPDIDLDAYDRYSVRRGQSEQTKAHMDIAVFNEEAKVQRQIALELENSDTVRQHASSTGLTTQQAVLDIIGLPDAEQLAQARANQVDPRTGQTLQADPTFTVNAFKGSGLRDKVQRSLLIGIQRSISRIVGLHSRSVSALERAKFELEREAKDLTERHESWLDRSKFSKFFAQRMKNMMRDVLKDVNGTSAQFGEVTQELRQLRLDLSRKHLIKQYGTALRKLSTTARLPKNFNILNFFETLMEDPNVSLLDDIGTIKENLRQNPNKYYDALTQDTAESDALLASLIAYARKDDIVMLNLEMSKMDALADRHAIRKRLNELLAQSQGDVRTSITELKENFQLEARARVAYLRAKRKRDQHKRAIQKAERTLSVTQTALNRYRDAESRLFGELGIHAETTWADGTVFPVPPSETATPEEVRNNPKTLKLSGSLPTNPAELEGYLDKMDAWLRWRQSEGKFDKEYHDVSGAFNKLVTGYIRRETEKPSSVGFVWSTNFASLPSIMKRFSSNNADAIGRMIKEFPAQLKAIRNKTTAIHNQIGRDYSKLIDLFRKNKSAMDHDAFVAQIYNPAVEFLSKQDDIDELDVSREEAWNIAIRRLSEHMMQIAGQKISGFHTEFDRVFSRLLAGHRDLNELYEAELDASGEGSVIDDDIEVINAEGVKVPAMRRRIKRGVLTVPRKISQDALGLFRTMSSTEFVKTPWQAFRNLSATAIKEYQESGADAAWAVLAGAFEHPTIKRMFVEPIFNSPSEANILPAPGPNYSSPLVDVVLDAYANSGGNLIAALEKIAQEHDAEPVAYITESLQAMHDLYRQLGSALRQTMPKEIGENAPSGDADLDSIQGVGYWSNLIPGVMVNARKVDHWPAAWFRNTFFDDKEVAGINSRVAAQKTFGINNKKLAAAFVNLRKEVHNQTDILATLATESHALGIDNKKERDAFMAERLGGKDVLKRLTALKALADRTLKSEKSLDKQLWQYFHGKESPTADLVLYKNLIGGFAGLMINQPASAMTQTSELLAPFLNFGVSPTTVRNVGRMSADSVRNLAGGLLNVFGINWERTNEDVQRYRKLGLNDPALYDQIKDVALRPNRDVGTFSEKVALITQRLTQLREASIKTKNSTNTPFRPLAPFSYYAQVLNESIIIGNWRITKEYIAKGLEAFSGNDQANLTLDEWSSELGLKGSEKDTFKKFMSTLESEYGLGFFRLVKEAHDRIDAQQDPLSDRTSYLLAGMALTNITQEGSIANMSLGSFNNPVIRLSLPLLGWPYRQSIKVADKLFRNSHGRIIFKDEEGRFTMQGISRALLAFTVIAGGGIGISLAVDAYSEELLRKRRNLAPLSSSEGTAKAVAVLEHLTRVGTFGLFGDFGLEAVNFGTGEGDLRGLSPERRIVAINSAFGVLRSFQAFLTQGFEADYNGVVRPMLYAMGGNGALQAIQIMNTVGGFENAESRAVRRTNVNNWLRAAGRITGEELRKSTGGFSSKTPTTPHITRMYLAALANDPVGFRLAYREAVQAARDDGRSEPESYIKRTFASRNPLQVFRTVPDDLTLARLLQSLPKQGQQDVRDALRMFEHYNDQITGSSAPARTAKRSQSIFSGGIF